jgi:hypothetical protein
MNWRLGDAYGRVGSDDREVDELMNIVAKSPNRAAIGDARGGLGPNSSDAAARAAVEQHCCVSIEEVEVGAADCGGRTPFRPDTPRVVH